MFYSIYLIHYKNGCLVASDFFHTFTQSIKGALSGLRQFLATESPLKLMKIAFLFHLKSSFALKILKFLSWLFGHVSGRLDQKDKVNCKFLTSQPGQETIVIHMLPNILRSKGNQTMTFSQLTECNMKNIFLEKSYTKCGGETCPRSFSEKLKLSISLDKLF